MLDYNIPTEKPSAYKRTWDNMWTSYTKFMHGIFNPLEKEVAPAEPTNKTASPFWWSLPTIKTPTVSVPEKNTATPKNITKPTSGSTGLTKKPLTLTPYVKSTAPDAIDPIIADLEKTVLAPYEKSIQTEPDITFTPDHDKYDIALGEYEQSLDESNTRANIVDAAKLGGNLLSIGSALSYNDPEKVKSPTFTAPRLLSPGQYMMAAANKNIDTASNLTTRSLLESGRANQLVAVNANVIDEKNKAAMAATQADIETINKQSMLDSEASNKTEEARINALNQDIENRMKTNLMKGATLTEALNALGEQGTQFINRMTQTDYSKWLAKMQTEQMRNMNAMYMNPLNL